MKLFRVSKMSNGNVQLPSMFMAREATATIVMSEMALSSINSPIARDVNGCASAGLNAVAVQKERNK